MTQIKLIYSIFGDLLNPRLFSDITKLKHSSTWYKGDFIANRPNNITRKETAWKFLTDLLKH